MGLRHVEIEIEELALHGFGRIDGAAVAESIQATLGSLLSSSGDLGATREVDRIEAPAIELAAGASERTIGGAVAERLQGSLRP
jgi:hypothetical protein